MRLRRRFAGWVNWQSGRDAARRHTETPRHRDQLIRSRIARCLRVSDSLARFNLRFEPPGRRLSRCPQPRFRRIKSRTFDPFGFRRRDEPPLPGYDWPFRGVRLTYGRKTLLAVCDIRAIRALPCVDKFCCPVPIAVPARDPFAAPRQAPRTCPGEQQQVLFSRSRGRYASVTLTNASDANERSGLSRAESETHQDDESDYEFSPPNTVACHVPPCDMRCPVSAALPPRFATQCSRIRRKRPQGRIR